MTRGIPGFVRLLTFAPVYSPKLPLATVGISPAIKLPGARVLVGVSGTEPIWSAPVTVSCAQAELTKKLRARHARLAAILHLNGCSFSKMKIDDTFRFCIKFVLKKWV